MLIFSKLLLQHSKCPVFRWKIITCLVVYRICHLSFFFLCAVGCYFVHLSLYKTVSLFCLLCSYAELLSIRCILPPCFASLSASSSPWILLCTGTWFLKKNYHSETKNRALSVSSTTTSITRIHGWNSSFLKLDIP